MLIEKLREMAMSGEETAMTELAKVYNHMSDIVSLRGDYVGFKYQALADYWEKRKRGYTAEELGGFVEYDIGGMSPVIEKTAVESCGLTDEILAETLFILGKSYYKGHKGADGMAMDIDKNKAIQLWEESAAFGNETANRVLKQLGFNGAEGTCEIDAPAQPEQSEEKQRLAAARERIAPYQARIAAGRGTFGLTAKGALTVAG